MFAQERKMHQLNILTLVVNSYYPPGVYFYNWMCTIFHPATEYANSTKIWTWTLLAVRWLREPPNHRAAAYRSISTHKSFQVALWQLICYAGKVGKRKQSKLNQTLNSGEETSPEMLVILAELRTALPTPKKKKKKWQETFWQPQVNSCQHSATKASWNCNIATYVRRIAEISASDLDIGFGHFWHQLGCTEGKGPIMVRK